MTIRLSCAECKRKLKVPDEALGKKVQCPVCGARFIGRIEANPSPVVPDSPTEIPLVQPPMALTPPVVAEVPAPAISLDEASLVDSVFADMTSPLMEETIEAAAPSSEPSSAHTFFPNLELEEAPIEPLEPVAIDAVEPLTLEDEEAVEVVDEAVVDEPAMEITDEAMEGLGVEEAVVEEEVEVVDVADEDSEIDEEESPRRSGKARKGTKSRKGLVVVLVGSLCVLLLGCGGVGLLIYLWGN